MKTIVIGSKAIKFDNELNVIGSIGSTYTYSVFDYIYVVEEDAEYVYENKTVQAKAGDIIFICIADRKYNKEFVGDIFVVTCEGLYERYKTYNEAKRLFNLEQESNKCCSSPCGDQA